MADRSKALQRARERAYSRAAERARAPQAVMSNDVLADGHLALAEKGKRTTLHISGNR